MSRLGKKSTGKARELCDRENGGSENLMGRMRNTQDRKRPAGLLCESVHIIDQTE